MIVMQNVAVHVHHSNCHPCFARQTRSTLMDRFRCEQTAMWVVVSGLQNYIACTGMREVTIGLGTRLVMVQ